MLIEFSVENFKVFREKTTLSMVAHKPYKEHPESTYVHPNFPDMTLSNSAVIYGANGAGKSSLVEAMRCLFDLIKHGFDSVNDAAGWSPFLFDELSSEGCTSFEVVFIGADDIKYHYGLSLNKQYIVSEFLLSFAKKGVKAKTLFSRVYDQSNGQYQYYCPGLNESKRTLSVIIEKVSSNPKVLLLSMLDQYESPQIKPAISWLNVHLSAVPFNDSEKFLRHFKSTLISELNDKDKGSVIKKVILQLLNQFDLSICDIQVIKRDIVLPENTSLMFKQHLLSDIGYEIIVFHQTASGKVFPINYDELSSGTKKLFDLSFFVLGAMAAAENSSGWTFIFDEFESSFHPHIVKKLYEMLVKQVDSQIQLIVTTHSPTLLDSDIVRRDQVWFVEKNGELASELYSLVDFSPTVKDNIAKGWMQGRYGAVPFIDWEQ